jgi:hypothetical protein
VYNIKYQLWFNIHLSDKVILFYIILISNFLFNFDKKMKYIDTCLQCYKFKKFLLVQAHIKYK